MIRLVRDWRTPKCLALQVTSCPAPIKPLVTPAIARSSVRPVDAMCSSMLRARSKQRAGGASISVSTRMTVISSPEYRSRREPSSTRSEAFDPLAPFGRSVADERQGNRRGDERRVVSRRVRLQRPIVSGVATGRRHRVRRRGAARLVELPVADQARLVAHQRLLVAALDLRRRASDVPDLELVEETVEALVVRWDCSRWSGSTGRWRARWFRPSPRW